MSKQILPARDVADRFDLGHLWLFSHYLKENPGMLVALHEGDTVLERLSLDPSILTEDIAAQIFTGNLIVKGAIHNVQTDESADSLVVLGNLWARNIAVGGQEIFVRGDVQVDEVLCASSNHGEITVLGNVSAKLVISDDSRLWIRGRLNAPVLNTHAACVTSMENDDKDGIHQQHGYVSPRAALIDEIVESDDEMNFNFSAFHDVISGGRSALRPEFMRTADVERLREGANLFQSAEEACNDDDYGRAIGLLQAALDSGFSPLQVRYRMVCAIFESRPADQIARDALPHLSACIEAGYQPIDCRIKRASLLISRSKPDHENAWTDCNWVVENSADNEDRAEALDLMGYSLYRRAKYAAAVPYLERAIAEDDHNANAYSNLARTLWRLGKEKQAMPHCNRALKLNPDWIYMYFVRGCCHRHAGNLEAAEQDLSRYVEYVPNSAKAWRILVPVYSKLGKRDQARLAAEHVQTLDPESVNTKLSAK